MGWIPGWPTDPTTPKGAMSPAAVVLHRTYGGWGGDYSVGKQGIFQFLIGKDPGQRVQFMATESVAYHCNGANRRAFGVELTGVNEDPLTDWQVENLGQILRYARDTHNIPLTYQNPYTTPQASISVNNTGFGGIISHVSVATDDGTSQHTDLITPEDYLKAIGPVPAPPSPPEEDTVTEWFATSPWDPTQLQVWWFTQAGHCYVPPSTWKVIQSNAALLGKPVPKPFKGTPEMFNESKLLTPK